MMETRVSSVLVTVLCILAGGAMLNAQEPVKPKPAESAARQSPVPAAEPAATPLAASPDVDAAKVDPSKMAAPPSHGDIKPPNAAPVDAKKFILGAEDMIVGTVWRSPEFYGQHMIRPAGK